MKLKLNIGERLCIAEFLPKDGSLSEQLIGKSILDKSFVNKEDRKELRFDPIYQGKIDPETDFEKEIDLSKEEFDMVYSEFMQKEKDKKINQINISLADKIMKAKSVEMAKEKK